MDYIDVLLFCINVLLAEFKVDVLGHGAFFKTIGGLIFDFGIFVREEFFILLFYQITIQALKSLF